MKTKYIMLTALLLVLGTANLQAQGPFKIGLQFGLGPSNFRYSGSENGKGQYNNMIGINADFLFQIHITSRWGIMLGMGYNMNGYKNNASLIQLPPDYDEWGNEIEGGWIEGGNTKLIFHNIHYGLTGYYRLPIWRNFAVRPTLGWFLDMRTNETEKEETEDGFNPYYGMRMVDTGPCFGVCVDLDKSLQVGFEYQLGLSDLMKPEFQTGIKQTSRTMNIYVRFLFGM